MATAFGSGVVLDEQGNKLTVKTGAAIDVELGGALKLAGVQVTASAAELNRASVSGRVVTVTTTPLTALLATHEGKTTVLSKADALAVTLPAASGSGARYRFVIGIAASGGSYSIATAPTTDVFAGIALGTDDDGVPANSWATASNSNKITMDGSTQGGKVGDIVEIEDIAAGVWAITNMRLTQSGTEATPFSHV